MPIASASRPVRLAELDQSKSHTPEKYREKLRAGHLRLLELQHALKEAKRSVIIVAEGPDAAGKGGMIKRLVERLDPRHIRVYSTIKPTDEEYAHHYSGGSGTSYRAAAKSPSSTARGMAVCSSSGSRVSAREPNGSARTVRSMNSNAFSMMTG